MTAWPTGTWLRSANRRGIPASSDDAPLRRDTAGGTRTVRNWAHVTGAGVNAWKPPYAAWKQSGCQAVLACLFLVPRMVNATMVFCATRFRAPACRGIAASSVRVFPLPPPAPRAIIAKWTRPWWIIFAAGSRMARWGGACRPPTVKRRPTARIPGCRYAMTAAPASRNECLVPLKSCNLPD